MGNEKQAPLAKVDLAGSSLQAFVEDDCAETREMFEGLSVEERNALAADVWSVGVRALGATARGTRSDDAPRKSTRLSTIPPSSW